MPAIAPIVVPITALYAALLAALILILMVVVIKLRRALRIGLGDGGNADLQRAMRAHGNAVETVPIFLILFAAFELNHGNVIVLHVCGAIFLLARVLHATGLFSGGGVSSGRLWGTAGTIGTIATLAIANVVKIFGA